MVRLVPFSGPDSATDLQCDLEQGTTAPSGSVSLSVSRCGDTYLLEGTNRSKGTKRNLNTVWSGLLSCEKPCHAQRLHCGSFCK